MSLLLKPWTVVQSQLFVTHLINMKIRLHNSVKITAICSALFVSAVAQAAQQPGDKEKERQTLEKTHRKEVLNAIKLPEGTSTFFDLPYIDDGNEHHTIDLYMPPGKGPFPVIFNIHGGGWVAGGKETAGLDTAIRWVRFGYAVVAPEYRFTPEAPFPAQIEDCKAAFQWMVSHAEQYHLNPNKVGVWGHSAGAHLAALMATTNDTTDFLKDPAIPVRIQAACIFAGQLDVTRETGGWPKPSFVWSEGEHSFMGTHYTDDLARRASSAYHIHPGLPPYLIVCGAKDDNTPYLQAVNFANALVKVGDPVILDFDPNVDHNICALQSTWDEALTFFDTVLKGPFPAGLDKVPTQSAH